MNAQALAQPLAIRIYARDNKVCVTLEKKRCNPVQCYFWLVGRHQQGVAYLPSGVKELCRTQSTE